MSRLDELRLIEEKDINNRAMRALITICVDASFSMSGSRINLVNQEIDKFLSEMYQNRVARDAVQICLIAFGHEAELKCKFDSIEQAMKANKEILINGAMGTKTCMGKGVECAISCLDEEIKKLDEIGIRHYKPWLIIISDGEATDLPLCKQVSKEVINRQRKGELKVKCLSMGDSTETEALKSFSIDGEVQQVGEIETMEFFSMLSRSISATSRSSIEMGDAF